MECRNCDKEIIKKSKESYGRLRSFCNRNCYESFREKNVLIPSCHPNKKYWGNDMCVDCYRKKWQNNWYHKNIEKGREKNRLSRLKRSEERIEMDRKNQLKWREKNKDYTRNYYLIKKYGITQEDYKVMLTKQNNKCAICQEKKFLHVDHCHKTGKIRGLLCSLCNRGLGFIRENVKEALNYLNNT